MPQPVPTWGSTRSYDLSKVRERETPSLTLCYLREAVEERHTARKEEKRRRKRGKKGGDETIKGEEWRAK